MFKKGSTLENVAHEFGVGRSTIGDIKSSESKLRSFATTMDGLGASSKKRKIMRMSGDDKLGEVLYLWFVQKRTRNIPVSGPILCEKVSLLYKCYTKRI